MTEPEREWTITTCLECGAITVPGHHMDEGTPWQPAHCVGATHGKPFPRHGPTQEVRVVEASRLSDALRRAEEVEREREELEARAELIRLACEGAHSNFREFADLILGLLDDPLCGCTPGTPHTQGDSDAEPKPPEEESDA